MDDLLVTLEIFFFQELVFYAICVHFGEIFENDFLRLVKFLFRCFKKKMVGVGLSGFFWNFLRVFKKIWNSEN